MIDLKLLRTQSNDVIENCHNRHVDVDVETLLNVDAELRRVKGERDSLRQQRNEISKKMKGKLSSEERKPLIESAKSLRNEEAEKDQYFKKLDQERQERLKQIPNFTHPETPVGHTDEDNKVLKHVGTPRKFDFETKDHVALMEALGLLDLDGGARVAGQKFYYLKNQAVFLKLALAQYALSLLRDEGFEIFITPDLARRSVLDGTGFSPRGEATQIYSIEDSDLCLIATSEITLGGLAAEQILKAEQLPLLYAGFSHCFRTEAGAAGRESKGLYRVHQFSKVEMFAFVHPDESEAMHQRLLALEERIYQDLEIPYRVVEVCTGDLGAPAYRKYDIEAWMPGRNKWGEVTSASNCTDYQSRRMNIRFKDPETKKNRFVHMLNGTAVAISRVLIALMENGQQEDGSITLPACLNIPNIPAP